MAIKNNHLARFNRDGSSLLHLASLRWLRWGLKDPLSGWLTHMAIKLGLVIIWVLRKGCGLSALVPLHVGLLGLPHSMVSGFQEWASQDSQVEKQGILWSSLRSHFWCTLLVKTVTIVYFQGEGAQSLLLSERNFSQIIRQECGGQ